MGNSPENNLFRIASGQQGYFTSAQAIEAGYDNSNHSYHVEQSNWIREIRGIYRLAKFPISNEGQYIIWSLWSRNRKGEIQGTYSHESALSLYDITDVMPSKLHMTVPKNFRRGKPLPKILILHKSTLHKKDIIQRQGYQLTSPYRTVLDIISEASLEDTFIKQAIIHFRNKGLLTKKQIYDMIEKHPKSARYFIDINQKGCDS